MKRLYKTPTLRCVDVQMGDHLMQGSITPDGDGAVTIPSEEDPVTDTEFDTKAQNAWAEW